MPRLSLARPGARGPVGGQAGFADVPGTHASGGVRAKYARLIARTQRKCREPHGCSGKGKGKREKGSVKGRLRLASSGRG